MRIDRGKIHGGRGVKKRVNYRYINIYEYTAQETPLKQ